MWEQGLPSPHEPLGSSPEDACARHRQGAKPFIQSC